MDVTMALLMAALKAAKLAARMARLTVVQLASGWKLELAVAAAAGIGTLFLYKGGLLADVRVGFLAFLMMYVGFLAIDAYCLSNFPVHGLLASIKDPNLLRFNGGQGIVVVASFMALGAWTLVDPGFHQRVSAARSPAMGQTGVLISVGFWALFDVLSITAGMYAIGKLDPLPADTLFRRAAARCRCRCRCRRRRRRRPLPPCVSAVCPVCPVCAVAGQSGTFDSLVPSPCALPSPGSLRNPRRAHCRSGKTAMKKDKALSLSFFSWHIMKHTPRAFAS